MAIITSGSESVASDFLHLASEAIRDTASSEGTLRTAVSRLYYAVYLTIRDRLFGSDGVGLSAPVRKRLRREFKTTYHWDPGSHDLVIFAITKTRRTRTLNPLMLFEQVSQLKEARVHADYHFTADNLRGISKDSWQDYAAENAALTAHVLPLAQRLTST